VPRPREGVKGLGSKYGGTLRKRYARIYRTQKAARECPSCSSMKLKRRASGVWECGSCGFVVAGGAYEPAQAKAR
jgi:large subunit ribosomal protein L37Ae